MLYVEAITTHTKNYDNCLFREISIGKDKKACLRRVLSNLTDYNRQDAFLDDNYADVNIYSAEMVNGVYLPGKLLQSLTVEPLYDYERVIESLD